jgi:quercetin dioxygenase-like cupin family protein
MDQPDRTRPYALQAGEGWTYRFGIDFSVKAGEIQGGSGAAFVEYVTRQGEEPSSHSHETEDEMFYVLEGAITFRCGEATFDLEQGGFVFLPHGIEHGYTIRGPDPVRLIVVTSPVREGASGGWGGFVADMELGQGELVATPRHAG